MSEFLKNYIILVESLSLGGFRSIAHVFYATIGLHRTYDGPQCLDSLERTISANPAY